MANEIVALPLEDVYPNPAHYREVRAENVALLAKNIAAAGQLQPIHVWRDGDIYIIEEGHHRAAALESLGAATIDAIVHDDQLIARMVASNMSFAPTPEEVSRGAQQVLRTGVRPEATAAMTGIDEQTVVRAARAIRVVEDSEQYSLE